MVGMWRTDSFGRWRGEVYRTLLGGQAKEDGGGKQLCCSQGTKGLV